MKIVMLCRLYSPHLGGVEKHVAGISSEAIKDGNSVDIFTLKHDSKLPSNETKKGIHIHRLNETSTSKVWERVRLWSWMLRNLPTFIQADSIQIHDVFYWYWPLRILLPWKKVYITYHGFEAGGLPTDKAKKTRQMIQRWTNGSMAVGSWIEKWYGTKADVITYGAADCIGKSPALKKTINSDSKLRCVFMGRIAEDTGARVYEHVITSLPNFHFDMYGEGSKQGTVADTCAVFPNYDVACVSSYLAILEAMQSKTLVVAYAVNELKYDYLMAHPRAEDMYIVRSEKELRDVLLHLSKAKTHQMTENAYEWAQQQTWNRVYLKYKKLWQVN